MWGGGNVANRARQVQVGRSGHGEHFGGIERSVEGESSISSPVAIDVFGTSELATAGIVVDEHLCHSIALVGETEITHDATLRLGVVAIIEQAEIVAPRGFQTRIPYFDVERIGVVHYIEQIGHRRLVRFSTIEEI